MGLCITALHGWAYELLLCMGGLMYYCSAWVGLRITALHRWAYVLLLCMNGLMYYCSACVVLSIMLCMCGPTYYCSACVGLGSACLAYLMPYISLMQKKNYKNYIAFN